MMAALTSSTPFLIKMIIVIIVTLQFLLSKVFFFAITKTELYNQENMGWRINFFGWDTHFFEPCTSNPLLLCPQYVFSYRCKYFITKNYRFTQIQNPLAFKHCAFWWYCKYFFVFFFGDRGSEHILCRKNGQSYCLHPSKDTIDFFYIWSLTFTLLKHTGTYWKYKL